MIMNRIGMKFIGATLTAAMAVTAIPAMASLAAERDFSYLYSSYKHDHADGPLEMVTREQLSNRLTTAMNFYYENESKIPEGVQNRCWEVFNYVSYVINNPESRPDNYAIANHDLMSTNRTIAFFGDSELPLKYLIPNQRHFRDSRESSTRWLSLRKSSATKWQLSQICMNITLLSH